MADEKQKEALPTYKDVYLRCYNNAPAWVTDLCRLIPEDALIDTNIVEPQGTYVTRYLYPLDCYNSYHIGRASMKDAERIKLNFPEATVYVKDLREMLTYFSGMSSKTLLIMQLCSENDLKLLQKHYINGKLGHWVVFSCKSNLDKAMWGLCKTSRVIKYNSKQISIFSSLPLLAFC
jgi:hypothetical protein